MKRLFIILFAAVLLTGCTDKQAEFEHKIELEDYLSDHAEEYVSWNCDPLDVYDYDYLLERVIEYDPEAAVDYIFDHYDLGEYMNKYYEPEDIFPGIEDKYFEEFMDEYREDIED